MSRLFGTDGIRGVANVDLKPPMAYALGRATAKRLAGPGGCIVVGQDTRRSGDMFVAAITAGATSLGVDVHAVGVVPTPALAFLARSGPYQAGIMVSASHNPADDNGLKVLDADGLKLAERFADRAAIGIEVAATDRQPLARQAGDALDDESARPVGVGGSDHFAPPSTAKHQRPAVDDYALAGDKLLGEEPVEVFATASCLIDPQIGALGEVDTAPLWGES